MTAMETPLFCFSLSLTSFRAEPTRPFQAAQHTVGKWQLPWHFPEVAVRSPLPKP